MQIIAIVNEKGGTGKTTTAVNLSAALGEMGQRILLVDLDGQAASSRWVGVEEDSRLAEAMLRGGGLEPIENVMEGVSLAPASGKLDSIAHDLRPTQGGQLKRVLGELHDRYDYALIDCPPSLGNRLIGNALLAATHAIAPVEPSILALDGLGILLTTIQDVRDGFEHDIILLGALACRYDGRTRLSKMVLAELNRTLPGKVFSTVIRETVRLQECPASGRSILEYAPDSTGAADYRTLARELLSETAIASEYEVSQENLAHEDELARPEQIMLAGFRERASGVFNTPSRAKSSPPDDRDLTPADRPGVPVESPEPPEAPPVAEEPEEMPAAMASFPDRLDADAESPSEDLVAAPCPSQEMIGEQLTDSSAYEGAWTEQDEGVGMAAGADREDQCASLVSSPTQTDVQVYPRPATSGATANRKAMAVKASLPILLLVVGLIVVWRVLGPGEGPPQTVAADSTIVSPEPDPAPAETVVPANPDPQIREAGTTPTEGGEVTEAPPITELARVEPTPDSARDHPSYVSLEAEPADPNVQTTGQLTEAQGTADQQPPMENVEFDRQEIQYILCPPGFALTCVMKTPGGHLAMINGRAVRVGQVVNGAEVIGISLKSVEMELEGKRFILGIGEQASVDVPADADGE